MVWKVLLLGVPLYTNLGFLGFCNISLIQSDGKNLIYDPGHFGNKEALLNSLKSIGLSVSDIDGVIVSHLHYDHSLNSLIFPKAKVYVSQREVEYALSGTSDPYIVNYLPTLLKDKLVKVKNGDEIYGLKFILLPGHTAGTMGTLYDDVLFVGDAIKYISDAKRRKTSFAYYNIDEANESINRALSIGKVIVPGHDIPFKIDGSTITPLVEYKNELIVYLKNNINIITKMEY
ncbi:beta-lactamase domain protein [Sulfolobus islandicus Y.G.57.14]|jgi:Zn-dependent hydrolases, including glyoxylases|uniref:Beta-lactamase domain protein n=1 Tax=Saccharolobus islandicus (strain Y.G.57.14 / Yellowstone \|nr:MBL fold metallo-hydrolase [Sulfolobus islandicus]ACP45225.1 beta-lactamase domain protein [Sulfolobus islandicus Y.G.57.14]